MGRERVASACGTALILVMVAVAVVSVATEVADAGPNLGVIEVASRDGDGDGDGNDTDDDDGDDGDGDGDGETGGGRAAVDTTGGAGAAGLDWPEGVGELATFVEDERDLQFLRPVAIEFLSSEDYAAEVSGGLDDEDVGDYVADAQFGHLRAFGLLVNDAHAIGAGADLTGEATGGAYLLGEDRIVVNGDGPLTTLQRRTLVHELTHAVTDQHLGAGHAFRAVETEEEAIALLALIEGDAERVSMRWLESLPEDDFAAIENEQAAIDAELEAGVMAAAPSTLVASLMLPYAVGPAFVEAVLADGGPAGLDAAYSAPPVTLEQVMDPIAYLEGDGPDHVPTPELPEGASVRGEPWTWGAYGVYTLLASRLPPQQALVAAQGWAGDTVVNWERDGHECAALAVRGETSSDDAELAEAMRAWAEAAPGASGNGPLAGGGWSVTGCAPGAADAVVHPAMDTMSFLALRSTLLAEAVRFEAFDLDVASAAADCTMAALDYEGLVAPGADPEATRRAVMDAWTGCADAAGELPVED